MASQTPNLNLYKVNPETDGEITFNVKTMLNENWDRLDESIGEVHQEITTHKAEDASLTQKGHVQLSDATNCTSLILGATANAVRKVQTYAEDLFRVTSAAPDGTDWNTRTDPGTNSLLLRGNYPNGPTPANVEYYYCVTLSLAAGNLLQIALPYLPAAVNNSSGVAIYLRSRYNNSWSGWIRQLHIRDLANIESQFAGKENTLAADQKRKITVSTASPSGGANGDIWIKYK